jgi:uncharacterized protein
MFEIKYYRENLSSPDLIGFEVRIKQTDLWVLADKDYTEEIKKSLDIYRLELEKYIFDYPWFEKSFNPVKVNDDGYPLIKLMSECSFIANVGPMASVAGAIAEFIGLDFVKKYNKDIIIENGGDIFLYTTKPRKIQIHTKNKWFKDKLSIKITDLNTPLGICTSSGKFGHSISLGKSDTVTILAKSAALADAAATAIGNIVKDPSDINKALDLAKNIKGVDGAVIICDDKIGIIGQNIILETN